VRKQRSPASKETKVAKPLRIEKELEQHQVRSVEEGRDPGPPESPSEPPRVLEDICVEELAIDGICGVY
jgi:mycofactocin precursor